MIVYIVLVDGADGPKVDIVFSVRESAERYIKVCSDGFTREIFVEGVL